MKNKEKTKAIKPWFSLCIKPYRRPGSNRHVREDTGFWGSRPCFSIPQNTDISTFSIFLNFQKLPFLSNFRNFLGTEPRISLKNTIWEFWQSLFLLSRQLFNDFSSQVSNQIIWLTEAFLFWPELGKRSKVFLNSKVTFHFYILLKNICRTIILWVNYMLKYS